MTTETTQTAATELPEEHLQLIVHMEKEWKNTVEWFSGSQEIIARGSYFKRQHGFEAWEQGNVQILLSGIEVCKNGRGEDGIGGRCIFPDQWEFHWVGTLKELLTALQKFGKEGNVRSIVNDKRMHAYRF